ncbi:hypothetical protein [Arthrobacter sp. UKPF54-2]|uniref:hypothetical protein n=1 Tax=Arthrobacter sp. UKPF54-2 TaxID=2600159 RepID=UPI0016471705|nr:hypothetical protein [Arthrobacter sp. UKPF54-2]
MLLPASALLMVPEVRRDGPVAALPGRRGRLIFAGLVGALGGLLLLAGTLAGV